MTTISQQQFESLVSQAVAKHKEGKIEEAIALYLESIEVDKNQPDWVYGNVITLLAQVNKAEQGLKLKEQALKNHPESDEIYRAMGLAANKQRDFKNTINYYLKSLEINQNQPDWLYSSLIEHLVNNNQLSRAVEVGQNGLKLHNSFAWINYHLAEAYAVLENWQEALSYYTKAAQIEAQIPNIENKINSAIMNIAQNKDQEAIALYLDLIELDSKQPVCIYNNLLTLMLNNQRWEQGLELGNKALQIHPESHEMKQLVEELQKYLQDTMQQNLINSLNQQVNNSNFLPENVQLKSTLEIQKRIKELHFEGPQKYQADDLIGALKCYQEAILLSKNSPEWIYSSAIVIAAKLGRVEEALEMGEQALDLYPDSDEIHRSMGIVFEIKDELINSIKHYQKSLELNPKQPDWVAIKLADHLESLSLEKHRLRDVRKATKLFNSSSEIKQNLSQAKIQLDDSINFSVIDNVSTETKLKGAVISWDMSHNPAGRAYLLADMAKIHFDVELIGPIFSFYGNDIWSPIKSQDMEMRVFPTSNFTDFVQGAIKLARVKKYDFVYVSKPRFPSLLIGMLIKHYSNCPLILDVDDHELSFFQNKPLASFEELIKSARNEDWYKPYGEIWTRFAESLIPTADALTVSNIALQQRFGGVIVRHARNENIFDPQLYNRTAIREQFGYQDGDRVILFLGTPRPHKGVFRIAQALENLNDPRLVLCIIGTITDKRIANQFAQYKNARIDFHDNQPWERLPELVSMADLICILQDPSSFIADYQIPAKLTDAMAMGIPTIVTKVLPLQDLIVSKSVIAVDDENLEMAIENFFQDPNSKFSQHSRERYSFLTEFTYGVNAERIKQALTIAKNKIEPFPEKYTQILQLISQETGIKILNQKSSNSIKSFSTTKTSVAINQDEPFNVLFFWKQNDSDIYGRRQDMIAKYLAKSDRINKIIHFDAPISAEKLQETVQYGPKAKFSQNNLVFTNTVDRFLGLKDTNKIIKRTFVYRDKNSSEKFLGKVLPQKSDYPNFVRQVIKESGIGRNTIAWVCPVNFEFPELHQELNFGCVIADIIDDQRQWDVKPQYLVRLSENYQQILSKADLVFTNCEPVRQSFLPLNSDIEVIPNGSEVFSNTHQWSKPEFLNTLQGSIIGYVGNLSDRIDIELLEYIATQNPDWNIVLIGSAHGSAQIFSLIKYANIFLLGVKSYDEATEYIKNFDVAIIPHIDNKLTKNMNPLKLYVYFSVGVPIVTTAISNIEEFAGNIYIASDRKDFNQGIKKMLNGQGIKPNADKRKQILADIDWEARVNKILTRIDKYFAKNSISQESNQFLIAESTQSLDNIINLENTDTTIAEQPAPKTKTNMSLQNEKKSLEPTELSYDDTCNFCGEQQTFYKNHNSLREGYQCCNCKSSLRYRGQAEAIIQIFAKPNITLLKDLAQDRGFQQLSIYEPGVIGPFRKYFSNCSNYVNSYFWSDVTPGDYKDGLQCQNLENLTYDSDRFDLVITSDIMEYIRHPWQAFQEIWRVLKPGGYHIFSIPVQVPMREKTFYRVDTSGDQDIHLVEARYHSAPKPQGGRQESLVYVDFGEDLIEELEKMNYQVTVLSPDYQANCDIHRLITFVSKKPK
jgi:tetratricopeptide (TPR) repeat protein/glycosyltransferase involved in cell wall biosynthesis